MFDLDLKHGGLMMDDSMGSNPVSSLSPAGASLFFGAENFLKDLSEADESAITGGNRSRSGRPKRRRRPKAKRRRRQIRSRSNSRS
jgi:hypothetical protein